MPAVSVNFAVEPQHAARYRNCRRGRSNGQIPLLILEPTDST